MGRAARVGRCRLSQADRLSARELGFLSRQAGGGRLFDRRENRRARRNRKTALHREGRAARKLAAPMRRSARISRRPMARIVRIFSTSGTTGTPSYIPLTEADLQQWIRISARSYAASGLTAGTRLISTYNAGPFVAGVGLDAFHALGLCHIPIGSGNTERLLTALIELRAEALALTPSYALHLAERARERGIDLPASSVRRSDRRRRARRRRAGDAGAARESVGREGHRGDGHRRHRRHALGRVRSAAGHAFFRSRLRAFRADRPGKRRAGRACRRRRGRAGLYASSAARRRRCCASAAAITCELWTGVCALRTHQPAHPLHRADRRHADRARRQRFPLGDP